LKSEDNTLCRDAVTTLSGMDPVLVANQLIPLLKTDISDATCQACMDALVNVGACLPLDDIRQDKWFENLKAEANSDNMELVSRIIGPRYFAYSILIGLQIESLRQPDPDLSQNEKTDTIVEFTTDSEMIQKLPLTQFNMQVASVLMDIGIDSVRKCTLPLDSQQALSIIGEMPLLVAPLFELYPTHLAAVQNGSRLQSAVAISTAREKAFLPIEDFHKLILQLLQFDVQRFGLSQLVLNFETAEAEEAYSQNNFDRVIHLLETWPGLLSTLLKTPAQKDLSLAQRKQIATGCTLLSGSYMHRNEPQWAVEVIRLGIRYTFDTPHANALFLEMGMILNQLREYGQAIGYLHHATIVSPESPVPWRELGKALYHQHRLMGAQLSFARARQLGADMNDVKEELEVIEKTFNNAGIR
jgi:hypothetical protein